MTDLLKRVRSRICSTLEFKFRYWNRRFAGTPRATIFFYPHVPAVRSLMYKMCHALGYAMTARADAPADIFFNWEDTTRRQSYDVLKRLSGSHAVLNLRCADISKSQVERVHAKTFGYHPGIDPLTHRGPCLKKSDINALHDCVIVQCPIAQREPGYVYEKLIDNTNAEGTALDMRVPIFGSIVPFCYVKAWPAEKRFVNYSSTTLHETRELLSDDEVTRLLGFAREMGMDYGELDVLRDRHDGRIYVVDANNTPDGPPRHLSAADYELALARAARAFSEAFLPRPP